jgi:hypothetical protein
MVLAMDAMLSLPEAVLRLVLLSEGRLLWLSIGLLLWRRLPIYYSKLLGPFTRGGLTRKRSRDRGSGRFNLPVYLVELLELSR